jgi:hypothetical protein
MRTQPRLFHLLLRSRDSLHTWSCCHYRQNPRPALRPDAPAANVTASACRGFSFFPSTSGPREPPSSGVPLGDPRRRERASTQGGTPLSSPTEAPAGSLSVSPDQPTTPGLLYAPVPPGPSEQLRSNELASSQVLEILCSVAGGSLKRSLGMAPFTWEKRHPQGLRAPTRSGAAGRLPPGADPNSRRWDVANEFDRVTPSLASFCRTPSRGNFPFFAGLAITDVIVCGAQYR